MALIFGAIFSIKIENQWKGAISENMAPIFGAIFSIKIEKQ